jgi:hypothetical protein
MRGWLQLGASMNEGIFRSLETCFVLDYKKIICHI